MSKQKIKFITSLRSSKYRLKYNCFLVEGAHSVKAFLNSKFQLHSIYALREWSIDNPSYTTEIVTYDELRKISG